MWHRQQNSGGAKTSGHCGGEETWSTHGFVRQLFCCSFEKQIPNEPHCCAASRHVTVSVQATLVFVCLFFPRPQRLTVLAYPASRIKGAEVASEQLDTLPVRFSCDNALDLSLSPSLCRSQTSPTAPPSARRMTLREGTRRRGSSAPLPHLPHLRGRCRPTHLPPSWARSLRAPGQPPRAPPLPPH